MQNRSVHLKNVKILGNVVSIYVTQGGEFEVSLPTGEVDADGVPGIKRYRHSSLDAAIQATRERLALDRKKIEVPFLDFSYKKDHYEFRPGVVTGIHAGTDNVIVRIDGGKAQQVASGAHETRSRSDLTKEQQDAYCQLRQDYTRVQSAMRAFEQANEVNLRKLATEALGLIPDPVDEPEAAPAADLAQD